MVSIVSLINQIRTEDHPIIMLDENRERNLFLIFKEGEQYSVLMENKERTVPFEDFAAAEHFLKRKFGAALARDEIYFGYLESYIYGSLTK